MRSDVVAILASGPSMSAAAAAAVRGARVRAIVTNDTWRLMPDAAVLFAADVPWWEAHPEALAFAGRKVVSGQNGPAGVDYVPPRPPKTGGNSALRAAHLAADEGAALIVLVGVDLRDDELTHWHGAHGHALHNPNERTFARARNAWLHFSAEPGRPRVVNCSERSALACFPKMALEAALA